MTDAQLTALSTICWIVGTATLFVVLAHWSAGGSWGVAAAVVRGISGWSGRGPGASRSASELPPLEAPQLDRLWGARAGLTNAAVTGAEDLRDAHTGADSIAELEDLGTRRWS